MSSPLITVVRSLRFDQDRIADLRVFSENDWRTLLPQCDRAHLTLPLAIRAAHELPEGARQRVERNLADNAVRHHRAVEAYQEIAAAFATHGVEHAVLKGFSQQPHYCRDLQHRPQYDLDFYCPPDSIDNALRVVRELGYESFGRSRSPMDHLLPLIRKTGWRPKDDYFDPDMPFTVELHHRFWDPETERFHAVETAALWQRRTIARCGAMEFPALSEHDRFSYATWHLVRHLVRGDLRAYHVYEIAHFLHHTAADDAWWSEWSKFKPGTAEGIAIRLAQEWFGCALHPVAQQLVEELPAAVEDWFLTFAWSSLISAQKPNKDELFLHLSLVPSLLDRTQVVRRRLFPVRFQPPVIDAHVPAPGSGLIWRRRLFGLWFTAKRVVYHLQALWPVAWSALRWGRIRTLPRPRWPRKLPAENAAP